MKILVTGASGYIGSHTLVDLIENGFEVVSVDNFSNSFPEALLGVEQITGKSFPHYTIDLCNKSLLEEVFEKEQNISGIIHFAAKKYVPESIEKPNLYYHNNIESLVNILDCCKKFDVQYFVFSSSCSVYGNIQHLPVDETCSFSKAESPYAFTKVIGERMIQDMAQAMNLKASLLRYFNPAGAHPSALIGEKPRQESLNIVPRITGAMKGEFPYFGIAGNDYPTQDGTCVRDYIHVCDIAHAHTLALKWLKAQNENTLVEVFNLGTGEGVSVLEMVKAFEKANDVRLNYKFEPRRLGDVVSIYADNRKAKNILGWEAKYSLEDMMRSAWQWDQKQDFIS
jgi:UDP-glucose 4-epimerase